MRFRSRIVEIEATQFRKDHPAVTELENDRYYVKGKQGWARVFPKDWIVTEPDGTGHYPCNPEVFAMRFEPMPEADISAEGQKVIRDLFDDGFNAVAEMRA